jgi:glycerophosphodiester phosphodiesterase
VHDVGTETGTFADSYLQQPNIPILFLTESGSSFMADIRASSLQQAIRFAARWNMLGIVSQCQVFKCLRLVRCAFLVKLG